MSISATICTLCWATGYQTYLYHSCDFVFVNGMTFVQIETSFTKPYLVRKDQQQVVQK